MKLNNVAVVEWTVGSGMSRNIFDSIQDLGCTATLFNPGEPAPLETELVFSYGPYGGFLEALNKVRGNLHHSLPKVIHWDTEGMPNFKLPKAILNPLGALRSWFGRLADSVHLGIKPIGEIFLVRFLNSWANRYRYFGDYRYAYTHKLIDHLFEYSTIYTDTYRRCGLPAQYIPWGTSKRDWADLKIERDIDVLWLGKRRTRTRTDNVERISQQLKKHHHNMLVVDGISHPYIFGEERTKILNRSKICLNLLPAWDFNNFPFRFHLAAPNGSMVISEPLLQHNPEYQPGFHFIVSPVDQIVDRIIYFLEHHEAREEVTHNARNLAINEMTLTKSIGKIIKQIQN